MTKKCSICDSESGYENPIGECFECEKDFCYEHLHCLQVKKGMKLNEPLRDVCDECQKLGYRIY